MNEPLSGRLVMDTYMNGWRLPPGIVMGRGYQDHKPEAWQDIAEITEFIDDILSLLQPERRKLALEIGLHKGGTHLVWKQIFESVMSIEINLNLVGLFWAGLLAQKGSRVVCSNSQLPVTRMLVEKELAGQKLDFLFIDGGHGFTEVESDYVNYEPMVAPGGIVAFHDTKNINDVSRFVKQLEDCEFLVPTDKLKFKHIHKSIGIAYYVKP